MVENNNKTMSNKFLFYLLTVAAGIIIWGIRLEGQVDAMTKREQLNKSQFQTVVDTVEEIRDTVIRIDKNQALIMRELDIGQ